VSFVHRSEDYTKRAVSAKDVLAKNRRVTPVTLSRQVRFVSRLPNTDRLQFDKDREAERRNAELERWKKLSGMSNRELRAQAYRELRNAGAFGTNKDQVRRNLQNGLSVVIYGAEIDHVDEIQFAASIAASIATANPGPVAAYLQQMVAESKATFLRNLQNAPAEARDQLLARFEQDFLRAIEQSLREHRPIRLPYNEVVMEVGMATYNNWIDVHYQTPRLADNGSALGIRLYRIEMQRHHRQIQLPNTFQPYVKIQLR